MRATQSTTYRSILSQLQNINNRLADLQMQSATGKKMTKASDDPSAIRPVLFSQAQITSSQRYTRSMDAGLDRIDNMDGHLDHMENILVRVKEVALAAVNGSLDAQNRLTYAEEVEGMSNELLDSANAQLDGKYLYAGYEVYTKPFTANPAYDPTTDPRPILYNGDDGAFQLEIGPGEQIDVNLTGNALLLGDKNFDSTTDAGAVDVFAVMKRVEEALRNDDPAAVEAELDNLDTAQEQVRSSRSLMGNAGARLETAKDRMADTEIQMKAVLSRYQDADLVQTLASLTQQETALQAALNVTGRLSKLSILDFV